MRRQASAPFPVFECDGAAWEDLQPVRMSPSLDPDSLVLTSAKLVYERDDGRWRDVETMPLSAAGGIPHEPARTDENYARKALRFALASRFAGHLYGDEPAPEWVDGFRGKGNDSPPAVMHRLRTIIRTITATPTEIAVDGRLVVCVKVAFGGLFALCGHCDGLRVIVRGQDDGGDVALRRRAAPVHYTRPDTGDHR